MSWDEYFIQMAEFVASKSKDPSTKTGVVIVGPDHEVLSVGYNGFPRGVVDNLERYQDREVKYSLVAHAETNAIFNAARAGVRLKGTTMYTSFGPVTCQECAKGIIQAGIVRLIGRKIDHDFGHGRWVESIRTGLMMLHEAGIHTQEVEIC
jgi:dCMP deaminase